LALPATLDVTNTGSGTLYLTRPIALDDLDNAWEATLGSNGRIIVPIDAPESILLRADEAAATAAVVRIVR
jgi:hypothetical protein